MRERYVSKQNISTIAAALKELNDRVVFVGGAVASLYAEESAAGDSRPTTDIDMTVEVLNISEWNKLEEQLRELGFMPDPEGHSINSYIYNGIPLDIMSTENTPIGESNRWFKIGLNDIRTIELYGTPVNIYSTPCYLASKFEAYAHRGTDYRTSHDIEDIIYVLNHCNTLIEEFLSTNVEVKQFLKEELTKIIRSPYCEEYITVHLEPQFSTETYPVILEKIQKLIETP